MLKESCSPHVLHSAGREAAVMHLILAALLHSTA